MMKPDQVRAWSAERPGVKDEADVVEGVVDSAIASADDTGVWPAHVHVNATAIFKRYIANGWKRRVPQDVIDEVIRRYAANGWNIRQGGSFLIIEQPGKPPGSGL